MDFFETVKKRKSIRKFLDKEVSMQKIEQILDAARLAPSALNSQPWDFVVILDKEIKKQIRAIYDHARSVKKLYKQDTSFVQNGTIIAVCSHRDSPKHVISSSLAAQNILLASTALNLGSVIMTAPLSTSADKEEIQELLKVPSAHDIIALVVVGHSDEKPESKLKRDLGEILHINEF